MEAERLRLNKLDFGREERFQLCRNSTGNMLEIGRKSLEMVWVEAESLSFKFLFRECMVELDRCRARALVRALGFRRFFLR
jgi:hypothetical protein